MTFTSKLILTTFLILGFANAHAQTQVQTQGTAPPGFRVGVVANPCAQTIPSGHQLNLDFGQLCRYEEANTKLPAPSPRRIIYFGDSITENWGADLPGLSPAPTTDVINRGISGQTSAQMLVRFKADVLNLKPRVVHLMMGTNDICGNTGATSLQRIEDAISSMAEQARANGIRVVIASVLPAKTIPWRAEVDPVPSISSLNQWLSSYASREGFIYVDYFAELNDGAGGFRAALTTDGVHPNQAGYSLMAPLAAAALQKADK